MAGRLDISNDGQHVGSELRRLRLAGHAHALHGAGGVGGVPSRFPRALAAARAALSLWLPINPETTRVPGYGWSEETRLMLRDRYNRCIT
jgi:hypothetical protein